MFSNDQQKKQIDVIIKTSDGAELEGKLSCGLTGSIALALNSPEQFIELEDNDGKIVFISKQQLAMVEPTKVTPQNMPKLNVVKANNEKWEKVLNISNNASYEEVKAAYHLLAKQYHPDKFSLDMPVEIRRYASEMLSRINNAYDQYKSLLQAA